MISTWNIYRLLNPGSFDVTHVTGCLEKSKIFCTFVLSEFKYEVTFLTSLVAVTTCPNPSTFRLA